MHKLLIFGVCIYINIYKVIDMSKYIYIYIYIYIQGYRGWAAFIMAADLRITCHMTLFGRRGVNYGELSN
jgi:hypothetical protein